LAATRSAFISARACPVAAGTTAMTCDAWGSQGAPELPSLKSG
jgi:hypothetical protein